MEHAKGRYHSAKMLDRQTGFPPYEAEFIVADLCEVRHVHCTCYCITAARIVSISLLTLLFCFKAGSKSSSYMESGLMVATSSSLTAAFFLCG